MDCWLITGGCGFLGIRLVKRLLSEGLVKIRVLDNLSVGTREDLASVCDFVEVSPFKVGSTDEDKEFSVELIVADIMDEQVALDVAKDVDVIVHFAANTGVGPSVKDPRFDCLTNVIGTLNYLEASRLNSVKRFVFASSGAPIGECTPPIHEEMPTHPVSPYGASKLAGEAYCSAYFRSYELETVALRFGNVYGPGSVHKKSVIAKFIKKAVDGKDLEIYGKGDQTRDFIYIDDLIEAVVKAAKEPKVGGEVFQIATHQESTIKEVAELLVKLLENQIGIKANIIYGDHRVGDVNRNFSDITKAKEMLRWQPQTSLLEGLKKTIHWFDAKMLGSGS